MLNKIINLPIIKNSAKVAQNVVLAGVGAAMVTSRESSKLFDLLVVAGSQAEKKGIQQVSEITGEAKTNLINRSHFIGKLYNDKTVKLQESVKQNVQLVLHRYGIPSSDEISSLSHRIAELQSSIKLPVNS